MKIAFLLAALATYSASATDVNVISSASTMAPSADVNVIRTAAQDMRDQVRVSSPSILSRPTALLNKNTLAMDNNVFISRSNLVFSQNDRVALAKRMEAYVMDHEKEDCAVLSKKIMRAVSAPQKDTILMSKASAAVTAAKAGDRAGMRVRIADLVDDVMKMGIRSDDSSDDASKDTKGTKDSKDSKDSADSKDTALASIRDAVKNMRGHAVVSKQTMSSVSTPDQDKSVMSSGMASISTGDKKQEQAIQAKMDADARIQFTGTRDILRQPSGVLNKNFVMTDNQNVVSRSQIAPRMNDNIVLRNNAKVADALASGSDILYYPGTKTEQAIQANRPRYIVMTGTRDVLRQPSGVVNKNMVLSDNQLTISRSQLSPTANDQVMMTDAAKVGDAIAPGSSILIKRMHE